MTEDQITNILQLPRGGGVSVTVDEHGWYTVRGPVAGLRGRRPPDASEGVPAGGLAALREARGDSVYRAAKATNLSHGQITRLEEGRGVAWTSMRSVSRYYGVGVGDLCEWIVAKTEARYEQGSAAEVAG